METTMNSQETKQCPHCGEIIKYRAIKCRFCKTMIESSSDALQTDVFIKGKGKELSWWKKVMLIYPLLKYLMLKEFSLKDGILTVSTQSNKSIQAPLMDVKSTYDVDKNDQMTIRIKTSEGRSIRIKESSWITSEEEWEQIMGILQPKETMFSKTLGFLNKILDIFK
jgi:hypothetical protein